MTILELSKTQFKNCQKHNVIILILKILNLVILILSFLPFFTDRKPTGPESSLDIMSIFTISLRWNI